MTADRIEVEPGIFVVANYRRWRHDDGKIHADGSESPAGRYEQISEDGTGWYRVPGSYQINKMSEDGK